MVQNCFLHPHAEQSPADGQLHVNGTAPSPPFLHRAWGRDNGDHMVPAFPEQGEHPGLCLPSEQPDLCSQSPGKGAAIRPFPHPSDLSFHLPCSTHSGFSRDFSRDFSCLNSAGLAEALKLNSDISWPTAFLAREKHPSGSRKVPFVSSQGKASSALPGPLDGKHSAWSHRGSHV